MEKRNIIVIGASAGGFDAIKELVMALPPNFDVAIFIVWHISPDVEGIMPSVLNNKQKNFHAAHAQDREPIKNGRIYIAPPDFHMLLDKGLIRVTRGPKENRFRPAIDPLFRSAAFSYGPRVIGVILSGWLDDGVAGLWMIKQYGGIAVVQDPSDAEVASMPLNALKAVKVDYKVPVAEMGLLLVKLINIQLPETTKAEKDARTEMEINIALEEAPLKNNILEYGKLTPYTCPECHGALAAIKEGDRVRFRCHTGHAFSADSLLASITENIENSLWSAVRIIRENVLLLNQLGDHFAEANQPRLAAMYFKKAKSAEERANIIRQAAESQEKLSLDNIQQQANNEPA